MSDFSSQEGHEALTENRTQLWLLVGVSPCAGNDFASSHVS